MEPLILLALIIVIVILLIFLGPVFTLFLLGFFLFLESRKTIVGGHEGIHQADISDIDDIHRMVQEFFISLGKKEKAASITIEEVRNRTLNMDNWTYVYKIEGKNVGFIHLEHDSMIITNIYVNEEYRKHNIGRKLLEYIITKASGKKLELSVSKSNPMYQKLLVYYQKFGFMVYDENDKEYKMSLF